MNYIPSHKFVISSRKKKIKKAQNKCAHVRTYIYIYKDIRNRIPYSFRLKI